jgi:hypothetical protein
MRALAAALALGIAFPSSALAQPQPSSQSAALPPGQPAGLKQAQRGDNTLALILGVGAIAGGIALVAANNSSDNNPVTSTTTTAP